MRACSCGVLGNDCGISMPCRLGLAARSFMFQPPGSALTGRWYARASRSAAWTRGDCAGRGSPCLARHGNGDSRRFRSRARDFHRCDGRSDLMTRLWLMLSFVASAHAADESDWRMPARDYAATRYSPLGEINVANVGQLKELWNFTTGVQAGHEAAPLYADGLIFVVTPYPNHVFALDTAGKVRWKYDPKTHPSSQGVACCDVVNRGAVYDGGRLYFNTLDGQTIALDARSGKELWRAKLGNIELGETITM